MPLGIYIRLIKEPVALFLIQKIKEENYDV